MSIIRTKHRQINHNVLLQNRLSKFTNLPMHTGDLYVEKNETVAGDLSVSGNLTIGHDLYANRFYATDNYYLNDYILIPPGTVIQSAAINEPAGWFECDGRELNRLVYTELFNAIGHTYSKIYGNTDLSFNIPDTRGRVAVGMGTGSGLTNRILGDTGGEESHTLSVNEIPSHRHSLTRRRNEDAGACDPNDLNIGESSAATTDRQTMGPFNTNSTGGSMSHNNMQPFIIFRNLIKY
jgi:microcystin-dependent protein